MPDTQPPTTMLGAIRIMVFGTGGPQTMTVATWPLVGVAAALLLALNILYGVITLLFARHWQWPPGWASSLGLGPAMGHVLLLPVRHRWLAVAGGLAAGLAVSQAVQHVGDVPIAVGPFAGWLAGVAAFASITHLPMRSSSAVNHDN